MNCDDIARLYRWIEYAAFGNALQRRRAAFLGNVSGARRVLALGDGDGRALVALLHAAPAARVDYVDASARMLELARARAGTNCADADRVEFRQADARVMPLDENAYDLIVTHFFLDCFDERDQPLLVDKIARAAAPEAVWIVSEFRPANRLAKLLIPVMYSFFGKATGLKTRRLVDHHPYLLRNGFRLDRSKQAWAGMLGSELWVRGAEE
jgi:ubiquinone/menaquinone biosynthesis C-methylase UbiE